MVRLSMNETTTFRWSFEQDVKEYKKAGYQAIGVWRHKLSDKGEEHAVRYLVENRLAVSNLFWAGGFTGAEGQKLAEIIDDAMVAIRLACCMDANCLVIYTGPQAGHIFKHAWRLAKEALRELTAVAEAMQVTLAIEPRSEPCAEGWTYLTELENSLRFLDDVGSDHLKLVYDTYHFGMIDPLWLEEQADRISVVHLGDAKQLPRSEQNRCPLGEGIIPIQELVAAINAGGYQGYFDVELCGQDIERYSYNFLLKHSRQVYQELICSLS